MEIDDYVRTKFNEIGRVVELCGKNSCGNLYKLDIKEQLYSEGNITKHSEDIIDLIENLDIVTISSLDNHTENDEKNSLIVKDFKFYKSKKLN